MIKAATKARVTVLLDHRMIEIVGLNELQMLTNRN